VCEVPEVPGQPEEKTKSIVVPYVSWTLLVILFFAAAQSLSVSKQYFTTDFNIIRNFSVIDWADAFLGKLTPRAPYPLVYQFWFLRDLFILNLMYPMIKYLVDKIPLGYMLITLFCWVNDVDLRVVSPEVLFFFSLGYYIIKYEASIDSLDSIRLGDLVFVYVVFIVLELFFMQKFILIHKLNVVIGTLFFARLKKNVVANDRLFASCAWLEQYSFFVYAFHETLLKVLKKTSVKLLPMRDGYLVVQYFSVVALGILLSLAIGMLLNKLLPGIYSTLTGERKNPRWRGRRNRAIRAHRCAEFRRRSSRLSSCWGRRRTRSAAATLTRWDRWTILLPIWNYCHFSIT
jgi:hypothetical protein